MDENNSENKITEENSENKIPENKTAGKSQATASMVLGIIAVALWFFGYTSIASMVLGIIGLVLASKSKKLGYIGGSRTAGFVLSLIGLIGGAIFFVACVACVGALGTAASAVGETAALDGLISGLSDI